jgi:hypothetical protein
MFRMMAASVSVMGRGKVKKWKVKGEKAEGD